MTTFAGLMPTLSAIILNKEAAAPVGEMSSYVRTEAVVNNACDYMMPCPPPRPPSTENSEPRTFAA